LVAIASGLLVTVFMAGISINTDAMVGHCHRRAGRRRHCGRGNVPCLRENSSGLTGAARRLFGLVGGAQPIVYAIIVVRWWLLFALEGMEGRIFAPLALLITSISIAVRSLTVTRRCSATICRRA
jgi:Cu/Ag efflux pump CusA